MADIEIAESIFIREYLEDIECNYSINDEGDEVFVVIYSDDYTGFDSFIAAEEGVSVEELEDHEDLKWLRSDYLWDYYPKTEKAMYLLKDDFKCEFRAVYLKEEVVDLCFRIKIADIKQKHLIEFRKNRITGILEDE